MKKEKEKGNGKDKEKEEGNGKDKEKEGNGKDQEKGNRDVDKKEKGNREEKDKNPEKAAEPRGQKRRWTPPAEAPPPATDADTPGAPAESKTKGKAAGKIPPADEEQPAKGKKQGAGKASTSNLEALDAASMKGWLKDLKPFTPLECTWGEGQVVAVRTFVERGSYLAQIRLGPKNFGCQVSDRDWDGFLAKLKVLKVLATRLAKKEVDKDTLNAQKAKMLAA